jgi:DNA-binding NtrC family response regulator
VVGLSPAALDAMRAYAWPGNVRELRNAIEHALVLGDGWTIEPSDLPEGIRAAAGTKEPDDESLVRLPARLDLLERRAIAAALRATGGSRTRAAALLGINRVTLYKKLRGEPAEP